MRKKSDIGSWLLTIFIIGLISTVFTSDIQFGALFKNLGSNNLETTLEYLNLGLAFLAFAFLFFFIITRLVRQGKYKERKFRPEDWEDQ